MEKDGSLPPVRFDRRYEKPPQHKQNKKRKEKDESDRHGFDEEARKRPSDPDHPSTIDLTA